MYHWYHHVFKFMTVLFLTCFVFSCAYHPRWDPTIKVPNFYDYKVKVGSLDVIADPYIEPYQMGYIFNSNLTEKGILALHLIIWNQGETAYDLNASEILIRSLEGREYRPITSQQASRKFLNNTVARMVTYGAVGSAFIYFTIPFALGAGVDSYLANRAIKKDYENKELERGLIAEKSLFQGFLFFQIADGEENIESAFNQFYRLILLGVRDADTGEVLDIQVPFELKIDKRLKHF